jgi:Uri superfamily endonuclease
VQGCVIPLQELAACLPGIPGTYAVILHLEDSRRLQVGRLGDFSFPPGLYVYFGSAHGPGGLRARLGRHLKGGDTLHWHVDYLLPVCSLVGLAYRVEPERNATERGVPGECLWSSRLALQGGAQIPAPRFGASDCQSGCPAHLLGFSFEKVGSLKRFFAQLDDKVMRAGAFFRNT